MAAYQPLFSSEKDSDDVLQYPSTVDQLKRPFAPWRPRSLKFPSFWTRQFRFLVCTLALFLLWIFILPLDFATRSHGIQHIFGPESATARAVRIDRQRQVRDAFVHSWNGYKKHAWLHDEVMPLTGGSRDPFVGWAATLVDGLDALYILGLEEEFNSSLKALELIDFETPKSDRVPVFETTIRYLGGLLGAYDISNGTHPVLLQKATQLGDFLFRAFDTPTGIPVPYYAWNNTEANRWDGENGVLIAQIGSLSLEFTRLSQLTGNRKYYDGISKVMGYLERAQNSTRIPGLWPAQVSTTDPPNFDGTAFTLGAWADSLYEYLPKYLRMYQYALSSAKRYHFFRPNIPHNPDILFAGSLSGVGDVPRLKSEVQHLGCFVGGMVALGSRINNSPSELKMAGKLTESCVWAYKNTPTGIMPEIFYVNPCPEKGPCVWREEPLKTPWGPNGMTKVFDATYSLRPEAIESVFIMYRLTGDKLWQEKGWEMFQAVMKYTTTEIANAKLLNVMDPKSKTVDSMESFWLAETLKYFYLLFSEPDLVSLDEFVLNTEAHPFRQRSGLFLP
ncbi:alpha-1,2-Mannosidase-4 [Coleophoma crateriformis]|uniref:alpha-1,2-Mannosidase n=1 Tax=Coleophoma crateriformis TaxID=565419 RepID=A0A3D8RVE0_9HELO|nr:alpha-1,2-Mannosidase-4 [Coleophoma crateriformis]